jgi:hypothetical protein
MNVMSVGGKVSDMCWVHIGDVDHDGYVPYDLGIGGGDYIELEINIETGQIINWKPLTIEMIKEAVDEA